MQRVLKGAKMQIIGDENICEFEPFVKVENLSATLRDKHVLFEFEPYLIKTAKDIGIRDFSVNANDITEAVLANAAGAKYIFATRSNLRDFARLAQRFMFDSKIAFVCSNKDDFEFAIRANADAAVFLKAFSS